MTSMRYLVTGGHGKLGRELCPLIDCAAPSHEELDILDPAAAAVAVADPGIEAVLHLAAISSRAEAERDKGRTYEVNVRGTRNMATAARQSGKKIIYISTDFVFDGKTGNYRENDTPSPPDWYGFTKYAGELEVQSAARDFLIIRTSFRPASWGFSTAYSNVYTTADYVDTIAREIALCLQINPPGIIHLGTPIKTFYELASRRNPTVLPEDCTDPSFPRHRDLCIENWLTVRRTHID